MDIVIVEEDQLFMDTAMRWLELKSMKNQIDEEMTKCLEEFQQYAGINPKESDFEGKVNLTCGKTKVILEYKYNRTIDKKLLKEICAKTGKPAQTYVNVKFEYPGVTMLDEMDPEALECLKDCTKTSRAKTSMNIEIK
jgi:hypothetical protein